MQTKKAGRMNGILRSNTVRNDKQICHTQTKTIFMVRHFYSGIVFDYLMKKKGMLAIVAHF